MKKRIILFTAICLSAFFAEAQNYKPVKDLLAINQYAKAKDEFDKNASNAKFMSKPEAYIIKASIYAGLAMSDENKSKPSGDQLTSDADAAFNKYKEMEPDMTLLSDLIYQNGPINLYSSYYTNGYTDYAAKHYEPAFQKFKKAVNYSDLLISRKLINVPMDTNVLILAGITAEQTDHKDDAAMYYGRLADKKITGEGFESVYRFLVSHAFEKKDMASFEKYKAYGKELFPKSAYFDYDKVDFAVGLVNGFNEKVKAVEEILATDPANYKANEVLGELIYDTLNPKSDDVPVPANAAELEKKMIDAFTKAAAANPKTENPYLYMGDHFINKAVKVNDLRAKHVKDMQARTKPGTKPSADDIKKRDELDKQYGVALEGAREPYEKVAAMFAAKGTLDVRDKQQYKKAVGYLADIFAFKKVQAKGNATEAAKYAAEEKKWNDLYESIK